MSTILQELYGGVIIWHLSYDITMQRILDASYWWPTRNRDIHEYCRTYDQCHRIGNLLTQHLAKLVTTLPKEPFQNWRLDFIGPIKVAGRTLGNQYIIITTDYATKWVEAQTFYTNTIAITAKFLYKHILMRFGCPLTIVTNQGTHFINVVIRYLTDHFIF